MKRLVVLSFIFTTGTIALAQQAAEWRPSIAEDNKAATLSDTIHFVTQTMHQDGSAAGTLDAESDGTCQLTIVALADARIMRPMRRRLDIWNPPQSMLKLASFYGLSSLRDVSNKGKPWTFTITRTVLDFAKVDPLEIKVSPKNDKWLLKLGSVSSSQFASITTAIYGGLASADHDDPGTAVALAKQLGLSSTCTSVTGFECQQAELDGRSSQASVLVSDNEAAKRLARAFMHAALLCGGTRSVSPF